MLVCLHKPFNIVDHATVIFAYAMVPRPNTQGTYRAPRRPDVRKPRRMDGIPPLCCHVRPWMYSSVYGVPPVSCMRCNNNGVQTQPGSCTPGSHKYTLWMADSLSPTSLEPKWLRTEFSVARFMLLLLLLLLMLLMFFADEHYVCSSVACLLCNTPKARYPHKCGVTAPL